MAEWNPFRPHTETMAVQVVATREKWEQNEQQLRQKGAAILLRGDCDPSTFHSSIGAYSHGNPLGKPPTIEWTMTGERTMSGRAAARCRLRDWWSVSRTGKWARRGKAVARGKRYDWYEPTCS